ncbi:hypothetical protein O181_024496 [Austropuccinia psidii MF-1]|uniref:Integrase catalytic domain-containing protein n=1 Tax=Austropuccinia psidii MF-1 TaxID=1389203 RepID=A0A9Q3GYP0_9BASI|nr:hypothetical protein [Austropuccinia psidii MF-1]
MDWVTGLVPGCKEDFNAFLVILERYSKSFRFLLSHKADTAMDTAFLFWKDIISKFGVPKLLTSDRDPKFILEFWTNLHDILGTDISFYTDYCLQTDGLAERMIQIMEDIITRLCSHGI